MTVTIRMHAFLAFLESSFLKISALCSVLITTIIMFRINSAHSAIKHVLIVQIVSLISVLNVAKI